VRAALRQVEVLRGVAFVVGMGALCRWRLPVRVCRWCLPAACAEEPLDLSGCRQRRRRISAPCSVFSLLVHDEERLDLAGCRKRRRCFSAAC
jgi:hypothetical protein